MQEATRNTLVLTLHSADGEENYPGNLEVVATYTVVEETLHLRLEAYADAATIVNLTNHAYWNLSGKPTIDSMTLEVRASAYTPVDAINIPDGRILPVEGTDFDLRKAALLGERNSAAHPDTAAGLDHNYVLDSEPGDKIAAILLDPESRHRLIVATDAPGLQVYTGEYLPQARQGIALEAQGFPMPSTRPTSPASSCVPASQPRAISPGPSGKGISAVPCAGKAGNVPARQTPKPRLSAFQACAVKDAA